MTNEDIVRIVNESFATEFEIEEDKLVRRPASRTILVWTASISWI
jgi:hypothetical protein